MVEINPLCIIESNGKEAMSAVDAKMSVDAEVRLVG